MFERFTDRARHVVVLAQEEARLLNHNYIGTEHVLLGLLGEPSSVAGAVLARYQLTRDEARTEVEGLVGRGKKAPPGHIPFTPRAKKTLELSLREALALGHKYIGTEHILLGLIREGDGVAAQILRSRADLADIRAATVEAVHQALGTSGEEGDDEANAVLRWLRTRLGRHTAGIVPFTVEAAETGGQPPRGTPAAEATLQQAARLAGPLPVGSHHLLLATLDDPQSAASTALASLGVDLDELRGKLRSAPLAGTTDEPLDQAGRRQLTIQVSPEAVQVVLTDPVIVRAGHDAAEALTAHAKAERAAAGEPEPEAGETTVRVIRGDEPLAAGLADVWRELHLALVKMAASASAASADPADPAPGTGAVS